MPIPQFVLASASPARSRLLQTVGIYPTVFPSGFDESQIQDIDPVRLVQTLAKSKAETVAPKFKSALILGCDSVLAINGEIHGKPADTQEAIARWQIMQNHSGDLHTGHVLIDTTQSRIIVKHQVTKVYFGQMSDRTIRAYVNTGEPLNCAGAFAIEGYGSLFVEKIEGCHTNVIGLSLPVLRHMLAELGYEVGDFW